MSEEKKKQFSGLYVALPLLGAVVIGGTFLGYWLFFSGEEGKPVPAPRNSNFSQTETSTEVIGEKVSITEEQLRAGGFEFAKVGEAPAPESAKAAVAGEVVANDYGATPVLSQLSGIVKTVDVELGSFVRRGQRIALIASDKLARMQSDFLERRAEFEEARKRYRRSLSLLEISDEQRTQLDGAEAKLTAARAEESEKSADFTRSKKLFSIGAISKRELETKETAYLTAVAKRKEAESALERAKKLLDVNPSRRNEIDSLLTTLRKKEAVLGSIREELSVFGMTSARINRLRSPSNIDSDIAIVSPGSGTVTERMIDRGQVVDANSKLVSITDLSTVWVIAQVFEDDLGKVRVGSGAGVSSKAFPDEYLRGNVTYVDPQLDPKTRTAKVRVVVPNGGGRLKLGMFVDVSLATVGGKEGTAPVVPESAIQFLGNRKVVFQKTDDPTSFLIKEVQTFEASNGKVLIRKGIFVGDEIVTDGSFLLRAEWLKTNSEG